MLRLRVVLACLLLAIPSMARVETSTSTTQELEELAERRYAEGQLGAARLLYRQLAELTDDSREKARVLVLAAWLAHQEERFPEAQSDLLAALLADPDLEFQSELYSESFVELYLRTADRARGERLSEARRQMERGIAALDRGDLAGARLAFDQVLLTVPNDPTAIYNLALVDLRAGKKDDAIAGLEKIETLAVGQPGKVRDELRVKALSNLGVLLLEAGSAEDAVTSLEKALVMAPDDASTWSHLGMAKRAGGDRLGASDAFRRAHELDSESPQTAINLAIAYMDLQLWKEASEVLRSASLSHPNDASVWLHLGLSLRGGKEIREAEPALARALALDPDNARGVGLRAATELTLVRLQLDDPVGARDAARQALVWHPDDATTLRRLGIAQRSLGELRASAESLEAALRLSPRDADTANHLGTTYFALEDWPKAIAAFSQAVEIRPGFSAAESNLTKARAAAGGAPTTPAPSAPPKRVALGVRFAAVDYSELGLEGALVDAVLPDTPASRGGLRKGDLLLKVDGQTIRDERQIQSYLYQDAADSVVFDLLREGRPLRLTVRLR